MPRRFVFPALTLVLLSGCGLSEPNTCSVSGTVTWNGDPLEDGDIIFHPADGQGVPDAGKIMDGEYELMVKPGAKRVEIRAVREGKFDPKMNAAPLVPFIPERYNRKSILKAQVAPDGSNRFPFALSDDSKK